MQQSKLHNIISFNTIHFGIIILFLTSRGTNGLVYPSGSQLQLTASMSVPVDIPDNRKLFMDLGFQMNFDLPFDLMSFYNPKIWSNALERRYKRQLVNITGIAKDLMEAEVGVHPSDVTAGELYASIERILQEYGFHKSCLLRSVCELALHPLDENHSYSYSLLVQAINFLLTPSQHEGFAQKEKIYQRQYERAERLGFMGNDCQKAYPKCELDILNAVTRVIS